jgi:hypothetical protein
MANYYTQGSFVFKLNTVEKAFALSVLDCVKDEAIDLKKKHKTVAAKTYDNAVYRIAKKLAAIFEEYEENKDLCLSFDAENDENGIWISDDNSLNGHNAAYFIYFILKHFNKDDSVVFELAQNCDGLRVDSFGGEAWFVTRKQVRFMSTNQWAYKQQKRHESALVGANN